MLAYQFADCVLDPSRRELVYEDQCRHLEPQVFDLLLLLIQAGGRVVTKAEIIERIWNGRAISDDALTSRIKKVRQAVGDDGRRQTLIRTHPRIGYQFAGAINGFDLEGSGVDYDGASPATTATPTDAADPTAHAAPSTKMLPSATARQANDGLPSLVIAPFLQLGSGVCDAFTDGLVEEISVALSRLQDLVVIARPAAYVRATRQMDAREVGRDLHVHYVVEGTVRCCADRARTSVRLVDAATGAQIWSDRYDEPVDDLIDLQDRIAERVASAVSASVRLQGRLAAA